jgi:dTDP-4-amino-4,6-dideoxygalactose transaminase
VIKVLVPKLPTLDQAMPYLRRAEEARHYTNFGQNVREFEERLSQKYAGAFVISVANCTLGLELVYMLKMIQGFRKIELPALTFPATWLAANRAGLEIIPIDVDRETWIAPGVAGFGVPSYAPVVDAAGAFGEQAVPILRGGMTVVFSGHATKTFGMGEAGWIVTWDEGEAQTLREMSNFGIQQGVSVFVGTNAKMSEFHAAFGLAGLDHWDREPWLQLYDWYDKHLPALVVKQKRPRGVYSLLPVKLPVPAAPVKDKMLEAGIETRRWYTPILTEHPLFQKMGNRKWRRDHPLKIPVTLDLAEHLIGLPYHLYLTEADVRQVCETLASSIEASQLARAA